MGGSSRPDNYNKKTMQPQESIDYFVDYVESWRIEMKNHFDEPLEDFTDFYLAAHSFGGYIAGNYALQYKHHIKRLLLISPIGIKPVFPDEPPLNPYKRFEGKVNGPPRGTEGIGRYFWNKKISPLTPGRVVWKKITIKMMEKYVIRRQKCDNEGQKEWVSKYLFHILTRKGTSEYALMVNFNFSL